jgi:hypothetical protein
MFLLISVQTVRVAMIETLVLKLDLVVERVTVAHALLDLS